MGTQVAGSIKAPITIVVPTSGGTEFGDELIGDLARQSIRPEAVHVVVNNVRAAVPGRSWHHDPSIQVSFLDRGHYYAKGVSFALRRVKTEYVAVVNDDVRLSPNWTEAMMEATSRHPQYGSFASRVVSLRDPNVLDSCGDSLYLCGRATANGWLESSSSWTQAQEVFSASGCLATYRMKDLHKAGLLDERFVAYMEDVDIGFRLQLLGRPCFFWPAAEAAHMGGGTRKTATFAARLAERNSILTMVKNLPRSLFSVAAVEMLKTHLRPYPFETPDPGLHGVMGSWVRLGS